MFIARPEVFNARPEPNNARPELFKAFPEPNNARPELFKAFPELFIVLPETLLQGKSVSRICRMICL